MPAKPTSSTRSKATKKSSSKKTTKKRSARSKPTPKPTAVEIDEQLIAKLLEAIVLEGEPEQSARRSFSRSHTPEQLDEHIVELRERIARSSRFDREVELGASIARLRSIMSKAIRSAELAVAVQAQKELAKLLALYPQAGSAGPKQDKPEQLDTIEQIEQHLRPLGVAPATYPIEGVARIVADKIRQYEARGTE